MVLSSFPCTPTVRGERGRAQQSSLIRPSLCFSTTSFYRLMLVAAFCSCLVVAARGRRRLLARCLPVLEVVEDILPLWCIDRHCKRRSPKRTSIKLRWWERMDTSFEVSSLNNRCASGHLRCGVSGQTKLPLDGYGGNLTTSSPHS
jgi:hypothetical protein